MRVRRWGDLSADDRNRLLDRRAVRDPQVEESVRSIVESVRREGDVAGNQGRPVGG